MSKSQSQLNEEKITASSYILEFYQNINHLTHYYAAYLNLVLKFKQTTQDGDFNFISASPTEKEEIMSILQNIRYYATKTWVQYQCTIEKISQDKIDKKISEFYKKIKETFVIERTDIEAYVIAMNKILLNHVMKSLLETSQDIIDQIYTE